MTVYNYYPSTRSEVANPVYCIPSDGGHTDKTQLSYYDQSASAYVEVAGSSDKTLLTGACGVALGSACQDLLNCDSTSDASDQEMKTNKQKEVVLLAQIVRSPMQLLKREGVGRRPTTLRPTSMRRLSDVGYALADHDGQLESFTNGRLVIGLENSIVSIQRVGNPTMVAEITKTLISWIPCVDSLQGWNSQTRLYASDGVSTVSLAMVSCLALSTTLSICHKMELMDEGLDTLTKGARMKKSKWPKLRARVVWDETNLGKIVANKPPRKKINEQKTPYHAPKSEDVMSPLLEVETDLGDAKYVKAISSALNQVASSSREHRRQSGL
eukprot:Gb_23419 [translate_table: standard]